MLKALITFVFSLLLCFVFAADQDDSIRRLHSVVSVTPTEGRVEAQSLFTQNIQHITSGSATERKDTLVIEIDQLEPIHIVPMCPKYENFAVTVKDRVLYKCGLRSSGTHPKHILMHLFLENDVLKIAQSQDSLCSDRRSKIKSKTKTQWKSQPEWISSHNTN